MFSAQVGSNIRKKYNYRSRTIFASSIVQPLYQNIFFFKAKPDNAAAKNFGGFFYYIFFPFLIHSVTSGRSPPQQLAPLKQSSAGAHSLKSM